MRSIAIPAPSSALGLLLGLLVAGAASGMDGEPSPHAEGIDVERYRLDWSDEFDGDALDRTRWAYRLDSHWGSTQCAGNVSVSAGNLRIALKREDGGNKKYTGGGIVTRKEFQYGFYETRMKIPASRGWHTSFWLTGYEPEDPQKVGGLGLLEIDVCEQDSLQRDTYKPALWVRFPKDASVEPKVSGYAKVATPDLPSDFHTWGCDYSETSVKYYFDGKETMRKDVSGYKTGPLHIWLSAIAANIGGKTGDPVDGELPDAAGYDYVRFWTIRE